MKLTPIRYLISTSIILITVVIFAAMDFPFSWIFYITILGQTLLIITVFKILQDNYSTEKKFEDFYEDHPIGNRK